jgi:hypothetical protein
MFLDDHEGLAFGGNRIFCGRPGPPVSRCDTYIRMAWFRGLKPAATVRCRCATDKAWQSKGEELLQPPSQNPLRLPV